MSKEKRPVPVQKGPISMDEQYNGNFQREPEMTRRDISNNEMRISGMTLTKHEPKKQINVRFFFPVVPSRFGVRFGVTPFF